MASTARGPGPTEAHQQLDTFLICIHAAEMLFTLMGNRVVLKVTWTTSEKADIVAARWKDGRLGTMRLPAPPSQ